MLFVTTLPKYSYLKTNSYYKLPIKLLVDAREYLGNPLIVWPKHHGGLGELRDHVRCCDLICGQEKLYRNR